MKRGFQVVIVSLAMILALSFSAHAAQRLVIFENQTSTG